jgi:hypothetical protein
MVLVVCFITYICFAGFSICFKISLDLINLKLQTKAMYSIPVGMEYDLWNLYCFTDRTNPTVECPIDQYKTGISRFTSITGLKAKGKYSADVTNKSYSIPTGMLWFLNFNFDNFIGLYLNLSLANEYVGDITITTQVIKYNQCCSNRISQSDCSIRNIKLINNVVY